jgi:hypothetical protein
LVPKFTITLKNAPASRDEVRVEADGIQANDDFVILYDQAFDEAAAPTTTKAIFRSDQVLHVLREDYSGSSSVVSAG